MAKAKTPKAGTKAKGEKRPRARSGGAPEGSASREPRGLSDAEAAELEARVRANAERAIAQSLRATEAFADKPDAVANLARLGAEAPLYAVRSASELQEKLRTKFVCAWIEREQLAFGRRAHDDENATVAVRWPSAEDARTTLSPWSETSLRYAHKNQPEVIARWIRPLMNDGPAAVLDTLAELLGAADPADLETNTLSWLGNRVSYHLRRALLLKTLEGAGWNLTVAAEQLHIGGASAVSRTIRDLGLNEEYAAARKRGAGKPGPKPKTP